MILDPEITDTLYNPKARKAAFERAWQTVNNPAQLNSVELIKQWAIIGECYRWEGNPTLSEDAYKKASTITQQIGDTELQGWIFKQLGDAMYFGKEYQKAIYYYKVALDVFERLKSLQELTNTYSQLSYACKQLKDEEHERLFLLSALAVPEIEPVTRGNFLERLALSLADSGCYAEAIENYEKALSTYESENFRRGWQDRLKNLAQIYGLIGDKDAENRTLQR